MGYTKFSTKNADYILDYGTHGIIFKNKTDLKNFNGIDALVLEHRSDNLEAILNKRCNIQHDTDKIVDYCRENNIPIYFTDPRRITKEGSKRIGFAITKASLKGLLGAAYHALKNGKVDTKKTLRWAKRSIKWNDAMLTGRDAVSAKKIEEYITPDIAKEKKKRPKIGLHYGGFHFSMPQILQSSYLRNKILKQLRDEIKKYYVREDINRTYKAVYDGKKWKLTCIETKVL